MSFEWGRKEFSKKLNDENDLQAKKAFIELATTLFKWTYIAGDDPRFPGRLDLKFFTQNKIEIWNEVERKLAKNWNEHGKKNNFSKVHVPYRKNKSQADVFTMFNYHLDTAAVGAMQTLKKAAVVELPEYYVDGELKTNDLMYDCDQTGFRYYTKYHQNGWVEIDMYGGLVTPENSSTYQYNKQTAFLLGVEI
jgi:hypothetical protein